MIDQQATLATWYRKPSECRYGRNRKKRGKKSTKSIGINPSINQMLANRFRENILWLDPFEKETIFYFESAEATLGLPRQDGLNLFYLNIRIVVNKKISVLLVDDHAVVRTGYKTYLSLSERIGDIYEAERGEIACQLYARLEPDVVVMDLSMPGFGGLESIRRLVVRHPHCKILVFSIHNELAYVTRAIKAGAKGYITKSNAPDVLTAAVCLIAEGGTFVEPDIAQQLAVSMATEMDESNRIKSLSPREFDIFRLLATGMSTREAAVSLCLSYKTVCNHCTSIKDKLGIKTLSELALLANRQGIVNPSKP